VRCGFARALKREARIVAEGAEYHYDVALSFAGEDRETVAAVADCLRGRGVRVFYDEFEKTRLWGTDLEAHLANVYMSWSRYVIMFVSRHYANKPWARHEGRAALARAVTERTEYVLPVRLDDTDLAGLLPTIAYLDLRRESPAEVCAQICAKLGLGSHTRKANAVASPWSASVQGSVAFDYSNHDGKYRIGQGVCEFETQWSRGSGSSIYCLNDPALLHGIALAPKGTAVADIHDAAALDFSSRVRMPGLGQVVVLENVNGFFAALCLTGIRDSTRYDGPDELTFDYWILRDGGRDFADVGSVGE
jgi:hypothetical protein